MEAFNPNLNTKYFHFTNADIALIITALIVSPFFWAGFLEHIGPVYPPLAPRHASEHDPFLDAEIAAGIVPLEYLEEFIRLNPIDPVCPCCGRSMLVGAHDYDSCFTAEGSDTEYEYDTDTCGGTQGDSEYYSN